MDTNKILSSLSYFSIFFAGFLFPLVVFFVTDDKRVKYHAKKAFLSHLLPLVSIPIVFLAAAIDGFWDVGWMQIFFVIAIIAAVILNFGVLIWNIVKGVKVLKEN